MEQVKIKEQNKKRIVLHENKIYLNKLNHPACVSAFIKRIKKCIENKVTDIVIVIRRNSAFPNACLPIAGFIQYYKAQYGINFIFDIPPGHFLASCGFESPYMLTGDEIIKEKHPFNKIICYSEPSQVAALTQSYINAISRSSECAPGVIDSLTWCLNEVMDNVLVHSKCEQGYILAQYHPREKHIAICIFDYGVGIYNTLKDSPHSPKNALDAISLSIQEGVGDGQGQGNGLYGLYGIIENNNGRLTITSGNASIFFKSKEELKKFNTLPIIDNNNYGTIVDFQMDLSNDVDITKIFKSIGGYDGFDIRLDDMLTDNDFYRYDVYENCSGTATREAGKASFNDVLNIMIRRNNPMILDFSNVHNVSSSYIDEFISKLVSKVGFYKFNQMFRLFGMNQTIEHLCNRAVTMRMYDEWANKDTERMNDETP